ncbi:hypothetical protein JOD63_003447 [Microbacterium terrae]|uniref:Uncharacterized protein n=1 Tax=Microbacterium terrae TaxID=69369 RepID=A0A0M2HJI1_9MICO|nr:hypothetical protein RS81_00512 [Microbacterium terrae]MBP1079479.1 hypothetical protein [Microbacterium terrae]GLJ96820.1 hypothetical protein GCM10017594_00170 [Microbacterium terrae]
MTNHNLRQTEQTPAAPPSGPRVGHPAYSLLMLVAGSLIQVGTVATAYVSSWDLAPRAPQGTVATS